MSEKCYKKEKRDRNVFARKLVNERQEKGIQKNNERAQKGQMGQTVS
jgi:hypothetical protein